MRLRRGILGSRQWLFGMSYHEAMHTRNACLWPRKRHERTHTATRWTNQPARARTTQILGSLPRKTRRHGADENLSTRVRHRRYPADLQPREQQHPPGSHANRGRKVSSAIACRQAAQRSSVSAKNTAKRTLPVHKGRQDWRKGPQAYARNTGIAQRTVDRKPEGETREEGEVDASVLCADFLSFAPGLAVLQLDHFWEISWLSCAAIRRVPAQAISQIA